MNLTVQNKCSVAAKAVREYLTRVVMSTTTTTTGTTDDDDDVDDEQRQRSLRVGIVS